MLFKSFHIYSIRQIILSGGLVFLLSSLFSLSAIAQKQPDEEVMPIDESGKYIHYEVVEGMTVPADSLRSRAVAFLKSRKLSAVHKGDNQLSASGKFLINKTALVLSRPSGVTAYTLVFEIKGDKYRFWLTDFVFTRYERDRYANFVPVPGKGIPLERNPDKLNSAGWMANVKAATELAESFSRDFKEFLAEERKAKVQGKARTVISTKAW